jgi:hypothetical protein
MAGRACQQREPERYVLPCVQSIPRKLQFVCNFWCSHVNAGLNQKNWADPETIKASPVTKETKEQRYGAILPLRKIIRVGQERET